MLTFCPTKLDRDVSTFYVPGLAETLSERFYTAGEGHRQFGPEIPNHRQSPAAAPAL